MTAWMNFKIGYCKTIFAHFSCLIYNVNITVKMPNLQYWKGKLSFALPTTVYIKFPVF